MTSVGGHLLFFASNLLSTNDEYSSVDKKDIVVRYLPSCEPQALVRTFDPGVDLEDYGGFESYDIKCGEAWSLGNAERYPQEDAEDRAQYANYIQGLAEDAEVDEKTARVYARTFSNFSSSPRDVRWHVMFGHPSFISEGPDVDRRDGLQKALLEEQTGEEIDDCDGWKTQATSFEVPGENGGPAEIRPAQQTLLLAIEEDFWPVLHHYTFVIYIDPEDLKALRFDRLRARFVCMG